MSDEVSRYKELIGSKLRDYRENVAVKTQEELSQELNINRSTLSLIEKGTQAPDLALLVRILQLTKMDFMELLDLKFRRYIVVDTNIILNRPLKLQNLVDDCDRVYIPETVINEINYQKDRGQGSKKANASQCLNVIIELQNSIIQVPAGVGANNDDKIFDCAKRIAKENPEDYVYLLTDDKDFLLKKAEKLINLRVINSQQYDELFKTDAKYDVSASQKFFYAVSKNDIENARKYTDYNINVNFVDGRTGFTPLIQAIRNKSNKMVDFLLGLPRIDINAVDEKKYCLPPISHAVQISNIGIITKLIQNGANVNEPSVAVKNPYNTPLMIAAWHGRDDIVQLLIANNACVNQADKGNGFTPLIKATFQNNPSTVAILLQHGADRSICSFEKKTALDYALEKNNDNQYKKVIDLLMN